MILKNFNIPSTMSPLGLDYLGSLATSVPENGVIVEIGPLFGSSTWVLAKNSHPSVRIFSIDTWEPAAWIDKVEAKYRNPKKFSLDAFRYYTRDCNNVFPIQGWSPSIVEDWDLPIDMFFDDATHGDPGFSENLNFFAPFVKPGAILCGDDYSHGWPDIVRVVDRQAKKWQCDPEIAGRVWAIRVPTEEDRGSEQVNLTPQYGDNVPEVTFGVKTRSGRHFAQPAGTWAGAVHQKDIITSISASLDTKGRDLQVVLQLKTSKGRALDLPTTGTAITLSEDEHISAFFCALDGADAKKYRLTAEASFTWFTGTGATFPLSGKSKDGWMRKKNEQYALTALRLQLAERKVIRAERIKRAFAALKSSSVKDLFAKLKRAVNL